MRCIAILGSVLILAWGSPYAVASGKPRATSWHGAIAYHRDSGRYGYAVDRPDAREARRVALRECQDPRCEVKLEIRNGCGALAKGGRRLAASKGSTREEAESKAIGKCGPDCEAVVWACTR
jgi:hypothetical protein